MHLPTLIIMILSYGASTASEGLSGCGLCDQTSFCNSGGHCCTVQEDSYQNWSNGTAQHRYSCTSTKLIHSGDQTMNLYPMDVNEATYLQHVWMISDCPTGYSNQTIKQLCEIPGVLDDFEKDVPVSDSSVHFRNKFCAYCNGINESLQLTYWYAELYCDADLSSSTNVLVAIVRRMCNLFFRPPQNIPAEECLEIQDRHRFENCNVTLQRSHNSNNTLHNQYPHTDVIDRNTCEFEPDSKHYLCYVCDEGHQWNRTGTVCLYLFPGHLSFDFPLFIDMLDIAAVMTAQQKNTPSGHCDSTLQVYDSKKMLCRELWCGEYRHLLDGECVMAKITELACIRSLCCYRIVFFIKLIPVTVNNKPRLAASGVTEELSNALYEFFKELVITADPLVDIPESVIESFRIYKKITIILSDNFVEYLVVQLAVNIKHYTTDFLSYMYTNIHNTSLFSFHEIFFNSEFVLYELVLYHNDDNYGWQFDPKIRFSADNILEQMHFHITLFNASSEWKCHKLFRKVSICPYLKLDPKEFSVQIENGSLIMSDNVTTARFSPWEIELNYIIYLCASDYMNHFKNPLSFYPNENTNQNGNSVKPVQIQLDLLVGLSIGCLSITHQ